MPAQRKYPDEMRERAVRLVRDAEAESGSSRKDACRRVGQQLGISMETLRGWVSRAEVDAGQRPGITSDTAARLAELERENRELRRANAIEAACRHEPSRVDTDDPELAGSGGDIARLAAALSGCSRSTGCRTAPDVAQEQPPQRGHTRRP